MRNPDPPYLEIGFYFQHLSGRDAFRTLTKSIVKDLHATPKEITILNSAENVLLRSSVSTLYSQRVSSNTELWKLIEDDKRFAVKLAVEKGTKIVPDAREYVAVLPITSSTPGTNGNSVAIWIEGAAFSGPSTQEAPSSKVRSIGQKARAVFVSLVQRMNPTYAAITVAYGLESPCDLRDDPRTYAFRDFYLQAEQFGAQVLQELRSRFPNADYEDLRSGLVVTTTKSFVRKLDGFAFSSTDAYELSSFVGKMIAMI